MKSYFLEIVLAALTLVGCGGGGSKGSDLLAGGLLGGRSGTVTLTENGCASYRPIPVTEIMFSHSISAQIVGDDRLNITFSDNNYSCNALNVHRFEGRFDASCGIQPLVDFLAGFECTQELVWSYSEPTVNDPDVRADVVRTAYVRCSQGGQLKLACPVEYRGSAFECLRGVCPTPEPIGAED
jgi:hypothetical protein